MKTHASFFVILSVLLLPASWVVGSGSYAPKPKPAAPQPVIAQAFVQEAKPVVIDTERYYLGQKLYTGKLRLSAKGVSEYRVKQQTKMLNQVKADLPEEIAKEFKVEKLAGKLNNKQFWSLRYYLHQRYVVPPRS